MEPAHFRRWLRSADGLPLPVSEKEKLQCRKFMVPNTIVIGVAKMWALPYVLLSRTALKAFAIVDKKGFLPVYLDYKISPWTSADITTYGSDLYGIVGFGHGGSKWTGALKGHWKVSKGNWVHPYQFTDGQFGLLALKVCFAKQSNPPWPDYVSTYGVSWLGSGVEVAGWQVGMIKAVRQAR